MTCLLLVENSLFSSLSSVSEAWDVFAFSSFTLVIFTLILCSLLFTLVDLILHTNKINVIGQPLAQQAVFLAAIDL